MSDQQQKAFDILHACSSPEEMGGELGKAGEIYGTMLAAIAVVVHDANAHTAADKVMEGLATAIHAHIDGMLAGLQERLH